jgi:hypothetical protein
MSKSIAKTTLPKSRPTFNSWMNYIHKEVNKVSLKTQHKILKNKFG